MAGKRKIDCSKENVSWAGKALGFSAVIVVALAVSVVVISVMTGTPINL